MLSHWQWVLIFPKWAIMWNGVCVCACPETWQVQSLTHWPTQSLIHSFFHSFRHVLLPVSKHSRVHSSRPFFQPFIHWFSWYFIYLFSCICWFCSTSFLGRWALTCSYILRFWIWTGWDWHVGCGRELQTLFWMSRAPKVSTVQISFMAEFLTIGPQPRHFGWTGWLGRVLLYWQYRGQGWRVKGSG